MTHSKDIEEFREKFPELWEGHVYPNGGANLNRVNEMIEEWLTTKLTEAEKRGAEARNLSIGTALRTIHETSSDAESGMNAVLDFADHLNPLPPPTNVHT